MSFISLKEQIWLEPKGNSLMKNTENNVLPLTISMI